MTLRHRPQKTLMTAKLAIVLATYHPNPEYWCKQLQSLQRQTWTHWICHVVDDGSSPTVQESIAESVREDRRFQFHPYPENVGSYRNFERGLALCAQDSTIAAIACCDQDDIWLPDKLERQWQALESESALLVHSDLELINAQDQTLHPSAWQFEQRHPQALTPRLLLLRNTITGCSLMFRSQLLSLLLPFPEQQGGDWCHDWWIALIAAARGKIVHLSTPLVRYRIHDRNSVGVVRQAGTLWQELITAVHKPEKLAGRSYLTHCYLSSAVYERLQWSEDNPFADQPLNWGWPILQLGWESWRRGYGSVGIAVRVFVHKWRKDVKRLLNCRSSCGVAPRTQ